MSLALRLAFFPAVTVGPIALVVAVGRLSRERDNWFRLGLLSGPLAVMLLAASSPISHYIRWPTDSWRAVGAAALGTSWLAGVIVVGATALFSSAVLARLLITSSWKRILPPVAWALWLGFLYILLLHYSVYDRFGFCLPPGWEVGGTCDLPPY